MMSFILPQLCAKYDKTVILTLFVFLFSIAIFSQENMAYVREKDAEKEKQLLEIKNNIMKSLFFRGEVADAIIESNLVSKITDKEFETYAEMRDYLIRWIEQNPERAAAMYSFKGKDGKIDLKTEIAYFIPYYEINPHFKELIENLEKVSKDYTLSDEELRLGGTRLFEGFINYGEGRIDISGDRSYGEADYKGSNIILENYNIDLLALNREEEGIKNIYNDFDKEIRALKSEKLLTKKEILYKKYLEFSLFIAGIKGRKKLNKVEAKNLENLRKKIRQYFIATKLLIFAADLQNICQILKDSLLKYDIEKFISLLEKEGELMLKEENLSLAYSFLKQSIDIYTNFKKELFLWQEISKISTDISNLKYSCLYDYFFYVFFDFFYKNNLYSEKRRKVIESYNFLKEMEIKVLERKVNSLGEKKLENFKRQLMEAKNAIEITNKISVFNRKQQFFMWEIFWPFGVKRENGKNAIFLNILESKIFYTD